MMAELDGNLLSVIDRLGKMEGLLIGLQTSINQSQAQVTGFLSRVESLEGRLLELEKGQVTRADLEGLGKKVDALATSDARSKGGVGALQWGVTTVLAVLATGAAVMALLREPDLPQLEGQVLPHNHTQEVR